MSIIFLVIGNSGAGKDTVIRAILEKYPTHKNKILEVLEIYLSKLGEYVSSEMTKRINQLKN